MFNSVYHQNDVELQKDDSGSSSLPKLPSIYDYDVKSIADFEEVVIALLSDPEITEEWEVLILTEFASYFSKNTGWLT